MRAIPQVPIDGEQYSGPWKSQSIPRPTTWSLNVPSFLLRARHPSIFPISEVCL